MVILSINPLAMKTQILNWLIAGVLAGISYPMCFAQTKKSVSKTIIVAKGDTLINGKRLADLDKAERDKLRKEFNGGDKKQLGAEEFDVMIERRDGTGDLVLKKYIKGNEGRLTEDSVVRLRINPPLIRLKRDSNVVAAIDDSVMIRKFHKKLESHDRLPVMPPYDFNVKIPNALREMELEDDRALPGKRKFSERPNSQSFNYSNTGKDGFTTRMNIFIGDLTKAEIKKVTDLESIDKPLLVEDLAVFPNFSSGKMSLSFSLESKGTITVTVKDADNKNVFFDTVKNFSGIYLKQANLPKNGIYYLSIMQNNNWFVKRIIKD